MQGDSEDEFFPHNARHQSRIGGADSNQMINNFVTDHNTATTHENETTAATTPHKQPSEQTTHPHRNSGSNKYDSGVDEDDSLIEFDPHPLHPRRTPTPDDKAVSLKNSHQRAVSNHAAQIKLHPH